MEKDESYKEILRDKFNISYLRPYQELIVNHILEADRNNSNCSLLGILPTGGGKSLCFMLPIMVLKKTTIIIYPLLSLMNDQEERFKKLGIAYEVLKGGMSREDRQKAIDRLTMHESLVLITNIEMLLYLVDSKLLSPLYGKISMVVIDEAHTVFTWGNTFRKAYKNTERILKILKPQHIVAFTATLDKKILDGIIKSIFNDITPYIVRASSDRENIFYYSIPTLNKREEIIKIATPDNRRPLIVFAESRKLTETLSEELKPYFDTNYYHAGMEKERKQDVERWFSTSNNGILVATIAYGMGIDVTNIRTIIHYSIPDEAANFIQESGRCGRDGKESESYTLSYPWEDKKLKYLFIGSSCIRYELLKAMNEEREETKCLACNHCIKKEYIRAGDREISRFIKHHPLCTKRKAIQKLLSKNILVRKYTLSSWREKEIDRAIEILILEGNVKRIMNKFLILGLKPKA